MKKLILSLCLLGTVSSVAAHGYYGYGYRNNWVAPAVVGAAIGYSMARPYYYAPVYYPPPPVYVQPPVYIQQSVPAGYVQQTMLDANCNCYRTVLVPNR